MRRWPIALCLCLCTAWAGAQAADIAASPPRVLSVTVYRAPYRNGGAINLDSLAGFALVSETRTVHLPPGDSRLRFEGVVDGIQPASAIVSGLPGGVIEKNRDAAVLSPEALLRAAVGADVTLVRTNRKTGRTVRVRATLRSATADGVMFETAQGIEALRCSGFPETFTFSRVPSGLSSTPTLSVLTRTNREVTATVTLSYLADGFDWAANYVADVDGRGGTLDLIAWITLANGNSVSLPDARTQIVAGRLNRVGRDSDPVDVQPRAVARCWPQGTTSDQLRNKDFDRMSFKAGWIEEVVVTARRVAAPMAMMAPAPPPPPPPPEQLGDLKLYRIPQSLTIAARQSKQIRLLEQADIPFVRIWSADLYAAGNQPVSPATALLRTKNDQEHHLGLPLPAGQIAVFSTAGGERLLIAEPPLRDTAVDEDVELKLGPSADVQVKQTRMSFSAGSPEITQLTPELALARHSGRAIEEVEITNSHDEPTPFELRLATYGSLRVTDADHAMGMKDGRPIFRLTLPANGSVKLWYAVADR